MHGIPCILATHTDLTLSRHNTPLEIPPPTLPAAECLEILAFWLPGSSGQLLADPDSSKQIRAAHGRSMQLPVVPSCLDRSWQLQATPSSSRHPQAAPGSSRALQAAPDSSRQLSSRQIQAAPGSSRQLQAASGEPQAAFLNDLRASLSVLLCGGRPSKG